MLQDKENIFRSSGFIVLLVFIVTFLSWSLFFTPSVKSFSPLTRLELDGKQVFQQEGCWYCHHPTLVGQRQASALQKPVSTAWLRAYLHSPKRFHHSSTMPSYRWLTHNNPKAKARLKALASYISSLSHHTYKGGLSQTERSKGEEIVEKKGEGKKLYAQNCAHCHGLDGKSREETHHFSYKKPVDLSNPKEFICRSGRDISTQDIYRTLSNGMSHSEMIPWKRKLSSQQLRSLVEYVRGFAPHQYVGRAATSRSQRVVDPYLQKTKLSSRQVVFTLPKSRRLTRPQFRGWYRSWWFKEFKQWKDKLKATHQKPWLQFKTWKTWVEWTRFAQWIKEDPRRWRASKKDWHAEQYSKLFKYFPKKVTEWSDKGIKKPLYEWLRLQIYKEISGEKRGEPWICWLSYRTRRWLPKSWQKRKCLNEYYSKLSRKLSKTGYRNYRSWRRDVEKLRFKEWLKNQKGWLFLAWRGQQSYNALGCVSCHGSDGKGLSVHLPQKIYVRHARSKKRGLWWLRSKQSRKIHSFEDGRFRCGSRPIDIFHTLRSFVAGRSSHIGISEEQLRKHLGTYPLPWSITNAHHIDKKVKELTAYILLLSKELPISRVSPSQ